MSEGFDAKEQARVDAHMRLMARFMDMVIEDPSILDDIPGGAYLFFLPEDDPAQAAIERRGAAQLASQGKTVYLRPLPADPSLPAEDMRLNRAAS